MILTFSLNRLKPPTREYLGFSGMSGTNFTHCVFQVEVLDQHSVKGAERLKADEVVPNLDKASNWGQVVAAVLKDCESAMINRGRFELETILTTREEA